MAREIKFRALVDDKMVYPDDSQFLLMFNGVVLDTRCKESNPVAKFCGNYDVWGWGISHNEPRVIMQYTGLKDKNGVEIYEGDIIDFTFFSYVGVEIEETKRGFIEFNGLGFIFCELNGEHFEMVNLKFDSESDIEIIGNIYENPELLSNEN